jgi:hypothetical protein
MPRSRQTPATLRTKEGREISVSITTRSVSDGTVIVTFSPPFEVLALTWEEAAFLSGALFTAGQQVRVPPYTPAQKPGD